MSGQGSLLRGRMASAPATGRHGRQALLVQAKMKSIAQNHKKSVWVNVDLDRLYTQPPYNPGRHVGPVKLQPLPGKGRGLVAERELPLAETALVCEPLGGALAGPEGTDLGPEDLLGHLLREQAEGRLGPADRARLRLLYDGSAADSPSSQRSRSVGLDDFAARMQERLRRAEAGPKKAKGKGFGAAPAAGTPAAAAATPAIDPVALGAPLLTPEELRPLVRFNCWGNSFAELGAAPLRQEPSRAVVGLWPEFAMLNHSCAPNTLTFNVGPYLMVQMAREVPQGAELTTCYLGELEQTPLAERRAMLRASYGFDCACERCKAEEKLPAAVSAAVAAAYAAGTCEEAMALRSAPTGATDRASVAGLEGALTRAVEGLEGAMQAAGLEAQACAWLRSSAWPAYWTLEALRDLPAQSKPGAGLFGGGPGSPKPFSDPEVPARLAAIVESVAPGSDTHLFLVLEAMSRAAETLAKDDPRMADLAKDCLRAHIVRYGRVSDAVLRELLQARSAVPHYLGTITLGTTQQQGAGAGAASAVTGPMLGGVTGVASEAQLRQAAAEVAGLV
ncbi:hypothetical protein HYH03_013378 [Edaphochlamys debaryana]|uniref:SET domain-containing protein n=1 Tax=Edaphochlamys debaryana TaxID=47281 RepID=A0A835XWF6_9CHLO|nr:hypothetical protein HYH03_013378 [Edaphochlamys debaryana]|eukprot:KAG2488075.1 hypothetical protein HYH03_013378 [Edaphochlamys debaryana]